MGDAPAVRFVCVCMLCVSGERVLSLASVRIRLYAMCVPRVTLFPACVSCAVRLLLACVFSAVL